MQPNLILKNPITAEPQSVVDTWFVDDLGLTMSEEKPDEIEAKGDMFDSFIIGELKDMGLCLNLDKTEAIVPLQEQKVNIFQEIST